MIGTWHVLAVLSAMGSGVFGRGVSLRGFGMD
jgi:hypothetical protein